MTHSKFSCGYAHQITLKFLVFISIIAFHGVHAIQNILCASSEFFEKSISNSSKISEYLFIINITFHLFSVESGVGLSILLIISEL
jgi:hypothetical protein